MRRFNHSPRYVKAINSARWKRATDIVRARQNDLCAECLKLGIATPIDSVHHIQPAESFPDKEYERMFYNLANLVGLCRKHHDEADLLLNKGTKEEHQRRAKAKAEEFIKQLCK